MSSWTRYPGGRFSAGLEEVAVQPKRTPTIHRTCLFLIRKVLISQRVLTNGAMLKRSRGLSDFQKGKRLSSFLIQAAPTSLKRKTFTTGNVIDVE